MTLEHATTGQPEEAAIADRWALTVLVAYAALWLLAQLPRRSLQFDVYEMIVMGQEWQASYWKHPPLPPWLAEIFFELFGRTTFGPAILSAATATISVFLVWRLSRSVFGPNGGLVALLLTLGSYYITFPVMQFNHNIAQLPFWAATILVYRLALREGRLWQWIVLGLVTWGLMSTKYTGALLLVAILAHAAATNEGRSAMRTYGPFLSALIALVLFAPQLTYLLSVNATSLRFPFSMPVEGFVQRILTPLALLGIQVIYQGSALFLVATPWIGKALRLRTWSVRFDRATAIDRSLLLATFFIPLGLAVLVGGVTGHRLRTEALGSMFMALGPALLAIPRSPVSIPINRLSIAVAALIVIAPPVGAGLNDPVRSVLAGRRAGMMISYESTARIIADEWQQLTGQPLTLIVASFQTGGRISIELPQQPSVMINGRFEHAPWVTPERIAAEGALVLWVQPQETDCGDPPETLMRDLADVSLNALVPVAVPGAGSQFCRAAILPSAETAG